MQFVSIALLSAFLPAVAAALPTPGVTVNAGCTATRFTTCASAEVQSARLGDARSSVLLIRGSGSVIGQASTASLSRPQILPVFRDDDGRLVECRPGGLDCRRVDTVITPEPVTMTLLATGLIGLAGANRLRRRKLAGP